MMVMADESRRMGRNAERRTVEFPQSVNNWKPKALTLSAFLGVLLGRGSATSAPLLTSGQTDTSERRGLF